MGTERQLVEVLTKIVDELRDLQRAGRMRDSESRAHIEFLERGLRLARERRANRHHRGKNGGMSGEWSGAAERGRMAS